MDDEDDKKNYLKNWRGGQADGKKIEEGFSKSSELPDAAKKAWESFTGLFVPKSRAKGTYQEDEE